jgi:hypothetical protein
MGLILEDEKFVWGGAAIAARVDNRMIAIMLREALTKSMQSRQGISAQA